MSASAEVIRQQPLRVHHAVGVGGRVPRALVGGRRAAVPRVLEAGGPCRADVARVNRDEVHVRAEPAGQALAAVVAGVEHNDGEYRHRHAQCGGRQRAQAARQVLEFVVRGHHHDDLLDICHGS